MLFLEKICLKVNKPKEETLFLRKGFCGITLSLRKGFLKTFFKKLF